MDDIKSESNVPAIGRGEPSSHSGVDQPGNIGPEIRSSNRPGGTTGGYLPRTWEITPDDNFLEIN